MPRSPKDGATTGSHTTCQHRSSTIDLAVEHAGRIRSPHSAILLFQIKGALGELLQGTRRPAIETRLRAEHRWFLGAAGRR